MKGKYCQGMCQSGESEVMCNLKVALWTVLHTMNVTALFIVWTYEGLFNYNVMVK